MATQTAATAAAKDLSAIASAKAEAQKNACSLDAMLNGGECESCQ